MMTFNLKVDLDNPSTSKFEVPSNMPYKVRLELYKGGLEHAAWDGNYGVGNVIPTSQSYEAKFSGNKWINSADAWKDGFFADEEGAVTVDSENPNLVTLNCSGRDACSDGVKLLINPTDTNWESIAEEGDADPRIASRIEIVFNYVSKEGCNPNGCGGHDDIPTKLSELENDVGYVTAEDIPEQTRLVASDKTGYVTGDGVYHYKQGLPRKITVIENGVETVCDKSSTTMINQWMSSPRHYKVTFPIQIPGAGTSGTWTLYIWDSPDSSDERVYTKEGDMYDDEVVFDEGISIKPIFTWMTDTLARQSTVQMQSAQMQQYASETERGLAGKRGLEDLEYTYPTDPQDPYRGIIDFRIELDGNDVYLNERTSYDVEDEHGAIDVEHKWFNSEVEDVFVTNIDGQSEYVIHAYDSEITTPKSQVEIGQPFNYTQDGVQKTGFIWAEYKKSRLQLVDEGKYQPKVLPNHLYKLDLEDSYDEFGKAWREEHFGEMPTGGCTTLKTASFMGRNYDWQYSDAAEFVVSLPHRGSKYASVGVASLGKNLTKTMVDGGEHTELYKALAGMTTDGINEKGLCASIHIVRSIPTEDAKWEGTTMDAFGAVRYVLDNFDNASDAANWIAENVYLPSAFVSETGYSVQFLIADADDAMVVQDGMAFPCDDLVLTNFRTSDGEDFHYEREEVANYDPYGMGIERYATALEFTQREEATTKQDLVDLMRSLNFTNAYVEDENPWYSDFTDPEKELSLSSDDEDFADSLAIGKLAYEVRDRFNPSEVEYDGQTYEVTTWQTVHNSIYDIPNRTLTIYAQEGNEPYVFNCGVAVDVPTNYVKTDEVNNITQSVEFYVGPNYISGVAVTGAGYDTLILGGIGGIIRQNPNSQTGIKSQQYQFPLDFGTDNSTQLVASREWVNDSGFVTHSEIDDTLEEHGLAIDGLADGQSAINEKIPSQASRTNQLADKAFVNSSIATNTGTFKGTFNSTSELPSTNVNPNDYAFVVDSDAAGNTLYKRYKWNGTAWAYEYTLNNSSFTSQQWATINGGPYASSSDIPTKVSDLTNDSGYQTSTQVQALIDAAITTVLEDEEF